MKKYLIGTDIGTSGTKSILMDTEGNLLASSLAEYGVLTPKSLWAEQWPDVWVGAVKTTIREVAKTSGVKKEEIKGACISGLYGGSGVPCDEKMNPVRPCIIWMDRRAETEQDWLEKNIGREKIYEITKNGTDPYYGYTKILWIKNNEPENWKKTKIFLPPNAYVIYKLTGEIAIDYSSAGNIGGIFDLEARTWSHEMLEALDIPESYMPKRLVSSSDIVGGLTEEAAGELGLNPGMPICAGGVDCVVATLGVGILEPGQHVAVIGTSMTWGFVHDKPLESKNLISMPYVKDARQMLFTFGGAATAGALPKWFKENFAGIEFAEENNGGISAYEVLNREAEQIAPGSEGLIILPYFMGERSPIWDVNARGTVFGLTLYHKRAHIYRAFLESVAYSLRHSMENIQTGAHLGEELILVGGVTKSKLWKQIFADVTGFPIVCPKENVEATLGDVLLAGVGTGTVYYDSIQQWIDFEEKIIPNQTNHKIYSKLFKHYLEIYPSLSEDMRKLSSTMRSLRRE